MTRLVSIAPGVRLDGTHALVVDVRIGSARTGQQRRVSKRFLRGTPEFDEYDLAGTLTKVEAWKHHQQGTLILAAPASSMRGTFDADVLTWLHKVQGPASYHAESVTLLGHWSAAMIPQERPRPAIRLGTLSRHDIQRLDLTSVISQWEKSGVAIGTCNKRLSRLRVFYEAMNGLTEPNPTDKIKFHKEPETEPRDIPVRLIKLILASMPDQGRAVKTKARPTTSQTKTRLAVMAWTGMSSATLQRMTLRHLDLKHARLYLTARRKGKGTPGVWVQLLPQAVTALEAFVKAGLLGKPWAGSSMRKSWSRGIERAAKAARVHAERTGDTSWVDELANLPPNCKPYDLRHSFASEVYRQTGDITAVKELLQHANLDTTRRYTGGAVSERVSIAVTKTAAAHAHVPTLPPAPTTQSGKARASMRLVRKAV